MSGQGRVQGAVHPHDFSFCVSVCDGAGGIPRAVDARRTRECVVGARCFAGIRSTRTCHRFSSCFSGSLVLAGAAAAREAVAFSLPASPEVVAPGACMTGAGFWNVSPGLAIPVAIPVRYAFPWCVANTPLSPDPFMLVEVMSQGRLRSLRMGRRGEDVQRVPKFRAPRRKRKRARCRVRRGFTHLERERSLHRRRCDQSAAVARGSMWSSPTRGRESCGTRTLLVLAHTVVPPPQSSLSIHPSLDSFFETRRFITPPTANTSVSRNHSAVRAVPISVHDTRKFSLETTPQGGSCLSNNSTGHFTTRAPARGAGVHRRSKAFQSTNMSVEEKAEARADGDAVVGEKKKRSSDDEAGDLAGEDRPATVRAKVDTSESDAALARALGGVPDADIEPSVAPNLGLSEVRTLPPTSSRVPRPPLPPRSF